MKEKKSLASETMAELYPTLGRFVAYFGSFEVNLTICVRILAGVPPHIARAFNTNPRVEGSFSTIKRLFASYEETLRAESKDGFKNDRALMEDIYKHVEPINKLRNTLVHSMIVTLPDETLEKLIRRTFEPNPDVKWVATNVLTALTHDNVESLPISIEMLDDALHDLQKASAHILAFENRLIAHRSSHPLPEDQGLPPDYFALLTQPWRYKQPQLKTKDQQKPKHRKGSSKPKRQP